MAKNIDFMGAVFPDVPSVKLPQQGGGLVAFDDTTDATATADKILQGYTAYAGGQKLTGTASGGITPSGTISITQNGVVDVTNYASADVNVSGGGDSPWNLLDSREFEITDSTTGQIASYPVGRDVFHSGETIFIKVRNKLGKTNGTFYGCDWFAPNPIKANGKTQSVSTDSFAGHVYNVSSAGQFTSDAIKSPALGIYPTSISQGGYVTLNFGYNSYYMKSRAGTYVVEVYNLAYPNGGTPFNE